jgi:putative acetyltransferase
LPEILVRPEQVADYGAIDAVVEAAFGSRVEPDLVTRIRASPEYVREMALVAEVEGEVVGHVMVSGATLRHEHDDRAICGLAPLAVRPDRHGEGIGSTLVRGVLAIADDRGEPLVVLEGSPTYYGRLGFEHAAPLGIVIPLPDWAPEEAGRAYDPDDPTLRGRLVWPAAFDGVE